MLLDLILTDDALTYAWLRVRENGGGAGADGVGLERFGEDLLARLSKLRSQLKSGQYVPDPLLRIELPRAGRAPRLLAVPTVRDRILQTAVAQVLNPILDPTFEAESFAYRPGRSVRDAVGSLIEARDAGFTWVVDADIAAFFDNIPHDELLAKLTAILPDTSVQPLIASWLATPIKTSNGFVRSERGVPQGSPISPLLSNLYLDDFDEVMTAHQNRRLIRYADDFVILAADQPTAEFALEEAGLWLAGAGLSINFEKTRIVTFEQGFVFLGVRFEGNAVWAEDEAAEIWLLPQEYLKHPNRKPKRAPVAQRKKPVGSAAPVPSVPAELNAPKEIRFDEALAPLLRTLYLGEPGAYLRQDGGRIVVEKEDQELFSIPHEKIDQVLIADEGAISFAVLRTLIAQGASLMLQGHAGEPLGVLMSASDTRIHLRVKQHERGRDAAFNLSMARAFVSGKIGNARLLLRRYYRFRPNGESPVDPLLREFQAKAQVAENLDSLRGFEGVAARHYFESFHDLLPESWKPHFSGRSRQPPNDPINALLSYSYAVLYQNVLTLVAARGLETHLGHLHALQDGHPALVSDLVEEFRALIADAVVLKLALDHPYNAADFSLEPITQAGKTTFFCRIGKTLRRQLIERLEEKLQSPVTHPISHESGDYRRMIRMQVAHYIQVLEGHAPSYHPFVLR
jgi:CRISPR-associated protein Cas1